MAPLLPLLARRGTGRSVLLVSHPRFLLNLAKGTSQKPVPLNTSPREDLGTPSPKYSVIATVGLAPAPHLTVPTAHPPPSGRYTVFEFLAGQSDKPT